MMANYRYGRAIRIPLLQLPLLIARFTPRIGPWLLGSRLLADPLLSGLGRKVLANVGRGRLAMSRAVDRLQVYLWTIRQKHQVNETLAAGASVRSRGVEQTSGDRRELPSQGLIVG